MREIKLFEPGDNVYHTENKVYGVVQRVAEKQFGKTFPDELTYDVLVTDTKGGAFVIQRFHKYLELDTLGPEKRKQIEKDKETIKDAQEVIRLLNKIYPNRGAYSYSTNVIHNLEDKIKELGKLSGNLT